MSSVRNRMLGLPQEEVSAPPVLELDPDQLMTQVQDAPTVVAPIEPMVAPIEPMVAPIELPELRYEYQPTDDQGRKLGGMQVIKYRKPEELAEKLVAQNIELVRKLREVTRKQKLGIVDDTPLPSAEDNFSSVELKEKSLSAEEVFQLTQDMNDPEKFVSARDRMIESAIGISPAELRQLLNSQQTAVLQSAVLDNYRKFEVETPEFWPCPENKQLLTDWMVTKGIVPTVANFKYALSKLKESGLIFEAPTVREETPAPVPPAATLAVVVPALPVPVSTEPKAVVPASNDNRIVETETPQQKRQPLRLPSGLNESNAPSGSGPTSTRIKLTVADFEAIPADELKVKLRDPKFAALVNELFTKKPAQLQ